VHPRQEQREEDADASAMAGKPEVVAEGALGQVTCRTPKPPYGSRTYRSTRHPAAYILAVILFCGCWSAP
jgi:hypothetical protein